MRILFCGDRNWTDYGKIVECMQTYLPTVVIEGEARGADLLSAKAAEEMGIEVERYPARWELYGRSAGPIRNKQMLDEGRPQMVIAFHSDITQSKGTKDMVSQALERGIPVKVIK